MDTVTDRIENDDWSTCVCGEEHDQTETGAGVVPVMRHHVALARGLRE
ncbi:MULTISPECIES: hypothetical protein [unclassified Streptomyces]|nr:MULTISPECIES: hypothetical protein [unclassified Streptomyces]